MGTPAAPQEGLDRDGTDDRLRAARGLLAEAGLRGTVAAAGQAAEIAAVRASPAELDRIAELASALRDLGFAYVALELSPAPEPRDGHA